jgi:RNA polymerase sigma-70 factor (ECF subfamily)
METLPEDQRAVLHLVCVEGLSYAETSQTLGIPQGTVMSRLSRARRALGEKVGINGRVGR